MLKINYYNDYITPEMLKYLLKQATPVLDVPNLVQVGIGGGLENSDSLDFVCKIYEQTEAELKSVLTKRTQDRFFIDQQTKACYEFNQFLNRDIESPDYQTIIGLEDANGRIVIGPKKENFHTAINEAPIAPIPDFLMGNHVTLFGPPDDAKLSVNAMNAYHRQLKDEPKVVSQLLKTQTNKPFWGADDEDSKTPLREDLISAGVNLTNCLDGTISFTDEKNSKTYHLEKDNLALPIKRFPGLALPTFFLFYKENPIPLHLYDFALHLFKNWHNEKALAFYVPKLENEEEARYIKNMIGSAENLIKKIHPEYKLGSVRLMIVLENPRAVFRVNEIIDELHPYFVGASLGWHDYLASTARLFKNDGNYRIPVKADPNIVIKYIKASHELLANVVGTRGGIKVGGMYGILPTTTDLKSPSFQITMKGYFKDVITQLKRDLTGFWVAHPDFVRIGLAIVEAWKQYSNGDKNNLEELVKGLLLPEYQREILDFIAGSDIVGLDISNPLYKRSLLVADIKESNFIANNHPNEIRYNVFQALQYLTDWLSGNGCVALPSEINGTPVRVMDDLATAERSRWEVWHELYYKRFSLEDFLVIVHEEYNFIRLDLSNDKKIVQVKWSERTQKWYPVAMNLMIRLMTDNNPVEFATELLLPFTINAVRSADNPWDKIREIDSKRFELDSYIIRFNYYFSLCGSHKFAKTMAANLSIDLLSAEKCIKSFSLADAVSAASFHGNIGDSLKTLDHMATKEQELVFKESNEVLDELINLGKAYREKFGIKFLVSAKGKTGIELLNILKSRINNTHEQELENANAQLWVITQKRLVDHPINNIHEKFLAVLNKFKVTGATISISTSLDSCQNIFLGKNSKNGGCVNEQTLFEVASLSKSVGSAFAIEYFLAKKIPLTTSVNELLEKYKSDFRVNSLSFNQPEWGNLVTLNHLMNHTALNLHYVNGIPANERMPKIEEFLTGNMKYNYSPIEVLNHPGLHFQYSGAGFIVLEYLLELMEQKSIDELTRPFLDKLGMHDFTFNQQTLPNNVYAHGYNNDGDEIEGTRKMFPSIAAGALGTTRSLNLFLNHLTKAFQNVDGSGCISHDTARLMLHGLDLGCRKFMNCLMGLGIFTIEAGPNKFALHQGANDGFRCIFLYCFEGPAIGKGLSVISNSELNGVFFNSEIAQIILSEFKLDGVDLNLFNSKFEFENLKQEEIVNIGYKNLLLNAFIPNRPEEIIDVGPRDELAQYNLVVGGKVLEVSNEKFARAENLISPLQPVFDPELFGAQGKIMDSWETVRHNIEEYDYLIIDLPKASQIKYASFSTKFHHGNHTPVVQVLGLDLQSNEWTEIVPKTNLDGHSLKCLKLNCLNREFKQIKVLAYPDGGLSRIGLYDELPSVFSADFLPVENSKSINFKDEIPKPLKPLATPYHPDKEEFIKNWNSLAIGAEYDVANRAFGGTIISASNEHYSPAIQAISPFGPMHMFDGFESSRSRVKGHTENAVIGLAHKAKIHRIEINFSYFVNNNPMGISLLGLTDGKWISLVENSPVKAFAKNIKNFKIESEYEFEQVKVIIHPDGGINRLRVFSIKK